MDTADKLPERVRAQCRRHNALVALSVGFLPQGIRPHATPMIMEMVTEDTSNWENDLDSLGARVKKLICYGCDQLDADVRPALASFGVEFDEAGAPVIGTWHDRRDHSDRIEKLVRAAISVAITEVVAPENEWQRKSLWVVGADC